MSNLGLGVMINMLGGGSPHEPKEYIGKTIKEAKFETDIFITFTDGIKIRISDEGQSCCEHRYITTDDEVSSLNGGVLVSIDLQDGDGIEKDYDVHDTMFLKIQTDKTCATFVTHNEHNGYYGGFSIYINEVSSAAD